MTQLLTFLIFLERKHVVLENVPDAITDEDLLKDVPEAKETIVFNYDPECAG